MNSEKTTTILTWLLVAACACAVFMMAITAGGMTSSDCGCGDNKNEIVNTKK